MRFSSLRRSESGSFRMPVSKKSLQSTAKTLDAKGVKGYNQSDSQNSSKTDILQED